MSERTFLFALGVSLWGILAYSAYYETVLPLHIFIGYLVFEGVTNIRVVNITRMFRQSHNIKTARFDNNCTTLLNKIEADRALRIVIAGFIYIAILLPDLLWFLPWFIASMLIMAGITNICPMNMFLKWAGLR